MQKPYQKISTWTGILLSMVILIFFCMRWNDFMEADLPFLTIPLLFLCIAGILFLTLKPISLQGKWESIYRISLFFVAPMISLICVEYLNNNFLWDIENPINIFTNYVLYLWLYGFIYLLSGSSKLSIHIMSPLFLAFGIANYFVKLYKGSPFIPYDLASLGTAQGVAGSYSFTITNQIILPFALTVLLWKAASMIARRKKNRALQLCSVVPSFLFVYIFYFTNIPADAWGAVPDFFNQTRGYEAYGAFAEFMVNTRYLSLQKPSTYNASTIEEDVLSSYDATTQSITETALQQKPASINEQPNIIVIMNESFSDLSVIGDFDTNEPVMPFIDSLKEDENTIEGNLYVSTFGTGTSNTEYEFLTGNSMAFLPSGSNAYQLYVQENQPSLVSTLNDQGYRSDALHPYYKEDWNRPAVYEDLGFETFVGLEDISHYRLLRNYVSDAWDFDQVQTMVRQNSSDQPYFMFNVTMQNHSSYEKQYSNFEQQITLENMQGDYPCTEQYLSLIHQTDADFQELIEYYQQQEQPTIILMFGDHQPFIEDAFYEEVMGSPISELSDDQNQQRYITRFILWANYDIPSGWIDSISANYLSTLLAENTGSQLTPYNHYLQSLYTKVPVVTQLGYRDTEDAYFNTPSESQYQKELQAYENIAYNNLKDISNRRNDLFYIEEETNS